MPTKKVAAKKPVARRKVLKPKVLAMKNIGDPQHVHVPALETMPGPNSSVSPRVVYLAGCRNCCHVPLGVNAMLVVLIAVIFTLSAMLMAASVAIGSHDVLISGADSVASVASR